MLQASLPEPTIAPRIAHPGVTRRTGGGAAVTKVVKQLEHWCCAMGTVACEPSEMLRAGAAWHLEKDMQRKRTVWRSSPPTLRRPIVAMGCAVPNVAEYRAYKLRLGSSRFTRPSCHIRLPHFPRVVCLALLLLSIQTGLRAWQ